MSRPPCRHFASIWATPCVDYACRRQSTPGHCAVLTGFQADLFVLYGAPSVIGVISPVFFAEHPATLDLEHGRVVFESRQTMAERRRLRGVPIQVRRHESMPLEMFVELTLAHGAAGLFQVDSGSTIVVVQPDLMDARATEAAAPTGIPTPKALGRPPSPWFTESEVYLTKAPDLRVRVPLQVGGVGEVGYDGLLGIPFLRQITFTIDIQYETLWVCG